MIKDSLNLIEKFFTLRKRNPYLPIMRASNQVTMGYMATGSVMDFEVPDWAKYLRISGPAANYFSLNSSSKPSVSVGNQETSEVRFTNGIGEILCCSEITNVRIQNGSGANSYVFVEFWREDAL
jgi:hypothetical protein